MNKRGIVKDYDKLDEAIQQQIKLNYPHGFDRHLFTLKNIEGKFVSALPLETDNRYYLVRMSKELAQEIIQEDDDYDDDGHLKENIKVEYQEKYEEIPEKELMKMNESDDEDS